MTPEQAAALRQPFPKSAIGKLPKGGTQLDYVGHAATTDRLLAIDPAWSWEPVAFDEQGLPAFQGRNLWIRLTVCGVTRYGVGDGGSVKECIGDAIRNAAMRFGVALDLWSKEELEQAHGPSAAAVSQAPPTQPTPPISDPAAAAPAPPVQPVEPTVNSAGSESDKPITSRTRGQMFALFGQKGVPEDAQLDGINRITGKDYGSRADVTEADARAVIEVLKKRPDVKAAPPQGQEIPA